MSTPQVPIVWAKLQQPVLADHVVVRSAVLDELTSVADGGGRRSQ